MDTLEKAKKDFFTRWLFGFGDHHKLIERIEQIDVLNRSCKTRLINGIQEHMRSPMLTIYIDLEEQALSRVFYV